MTEPEEDLSWSRIRALVTKRIEGSPNIPDYLKEPAKEVAVAIFNTIPRAIGNLELAYHRTRRVVEKEKEK